MFVVVVTAFVASSITQVARAVFFGGTDAEGAPDTSPKVGADCGEALTQELRAIEAARSVASLEPNGDAARARFASERRPEAGRSPAKQACASDAHGPDALAAVARLDRTAEADCVRAASELRPVRVAAQSFIRGPLR